MPDDPYTYRTRQGDAVDRQGYALRPGPYGMRPMRTYIGPPVLPCTADTGTECADGSRQSLQDEPAWDGCPFCGHRECYPGPPCALCQLTVRINSLEASRMHP